MNGGANFRMGFGVILLAALVLTGCQTGKRTEPDGAIVGGPCEYEDVPGTATIVSVETADPAEANCANDPVAVIFDFTPDDAEAGSKLPRLAGPGAEADHR